MPELNVLSGIADFSTESEQPVTKHLIVQVTPSHANGPIENDVVHALTDQLN
jgi:hypothetical protein